MLEIKIEDTLYHRNDNEDILDAKHWVSDEMAKYIMPSPNHIGQTVSVLAHREITRAGNGTIDFNVTTLDQTRYGKSSVSMQFTLSITEVQSLINGLQALLDKPLRVNKHDNSDRAKNYTLVLDDNGNVDFTAVLADQ